MLLFFKDCLQPAMRSLREILRAAARHRCAMRRWLLLLVVVVVILVLLVDVMVVVVQRSALWGAMQGCACALLQQHDAAAS